MSDLHTLIIGASSDIGCGLVRELENEEQTILAHYNKNTDKVSRLVGMSRNKIIPLQADLSLKEAPFTLLNRVEEICTCPERIIFLSAPKIKNIRFKDITWDFFEEQLNIQLKSAVIILNHFLPKMAKAKSGKVIFLLSSYTLGVPPMALSHYVTTKYSILGLMKSLAAEYAPHGININAVSPSMIETAFLSELPDKIVELNAFNHPLKRNAKVSDIVPVIKNLISENSNFLNGVNVPIAGGLIF